MNKKIRPVVLCVSIIVMLATASLARIPVEFGFKGGLSVATQSDNNIAFRPWDHDILSDPVYADDYSQNSLTGYEFGYFLTFDVSRYFSIQHELLFTRKGVKVSGVGTFEDSFAGDDLTAEYTVISDKIELTYIEIPVLLKFKLPRRGNLRPSLFVGPNLAFNIEHSRALDVEYEVWAGDFWTDGFIAGEPDITNLNSTDIGLVFGGDLRIPAGRLTLVLDVRYKMGMTDVFEDIDAEDVGLLINARPERLPVANLYSGEASGVKNRALSVTLGLSFSL